MKAIKIFGVLLLLSVLSACAKETSDVAKQDGFSVGYKKIEVESKATGDNFPVALVYPSVTPSEQVRFGPFEMQLAVGGKIAVGKFPLVIISHGSGGTNLGYRSIAFALVKKGFVVGMPLHPGNNYKNNHAEGTVENWSNRPLHISSSIGAIVSHPKIKESIDVEKIAVVGHSAGAYTALAVAGGMADTSHIVELCLSNTKINEPFCGLVKDNKTAAVEIASTRDERVKAIVLMAPVGILFKSENALAEVDIPAFLLKAEKDAELTEPYQSDVIARNYKNKKLLTNCTVENAGHYSFITPFPDELKNELGVVASDPEGFDRREFHHLLSADVLGFLEGVFSLEKSKKFQPVSCLLN